MVFLQKSTDPVVRKSLKSTDPVVRKSLKSTDPVVRKSPLIKKNVT